MIDLTLPLTKEMVKNNKVGIELAGHLGTHFDVMNKVFPLEYTELQGIVFDVYGKDEIQKEDVDLSVVQEKMAVLFYTGQSERFQYGSEEYRHEHPQLSKELIAALLEKKVAIIGIDAQGIRRHEEHTPTDQLCADHGTFVIENLYNLKEAAVLNRVIKVSTYPMNYVGLSGLPCRVIVR